MLENPTKVPGDMKGTGLAIVYIVICFTKFTSILGVESVEDDEKQDSF
jgi:hypothetical protein